MERILGDSLAFAAKTRYWSHSTEPVKGTLVLLATAVAYVKGLEVPRLLGLRGPSWWKVTSGAFGWPPWPLGVTGVGSLSASEAKGDLT